MNLYSYFVRLESVLRSRQEIQVENSSFDVTPEGTKFECQLRFYDGSRLVISELVEEVRKRAIHRIDYKFHYQDADGNLIFRYDNAPHHPHIPTFPDHKHEGDAIVEAEPPDLSDVLAEIDAIIYTDE